MAFILIADDDELIAELAAQALTDAGLISGWVTSAEECWKLLKTRRPDALLLDQDMPGMTGLSLLKKLRATKEYSDLPVLMFTAMSGAQDETRAMYAGAQGFIRKPFDPRGLTSRVKRVLVRGQERSHHKVMQTHLAQSERLASGAMGPRRVL